MSRKSVHIYTGQRFLRLAGSVRKDAALLLRPVSIYYPADSEPTVMNRLTTSLKLEAASILIE
jgi:hypothetical protein